VLSREEQQSGLHFFDQEGKRLVYTILPAELDNAIHQKHDGVVVGGLAPQLRIYDEADPIVASALQPEKLALAESLKVEAERKMEADEAERKRLLAQAAAREASELATANTALAAEKAKADSAASELEVLRAELAKANAAKAAAEKAKAETDALLAEATKPAAAAGATGNASGTGGGDASGASKRGGGGKAGG